MRSCTDASSAQGRLHALVVCDGHQSTRTVVGCAVHRALSSRSGRAAAPAQHSARTGWEAKVCEGMGGKVGLEAVQGHWLEAVQGQGVSVGVCTGRVCKQVGLVWGLPSGQAGWGRCTVRVSPPPPPKKK